MIRTVLRIRTGSTHRSFTDAILKRQTNKEALKHEAIFVAQQIFVEPVYKVSYYPVDIENISFLQILATSLRRWKPSRTSLIRREIQSEKFSKSTEQPGSHMLEDLLSVLPKLNSVGITLQ